MDHAEVAALKLAGESASGKTLYVTLEPCNHDGKTAAVRRRDPQGRHQAGRIGCRDPNPNVSGGGIERLEAAGVQVRVGVLEDEARHAIKPWVKFITDGAAYLTLKLAISLDGRIATRTGASKWITGADSRARVQLLRSQHDAVMVGINTVLADDPRLTVRDVPGRNPIRVGGGQQAPTAAHEPRGHDARSSSHVRHYDHRRTTIRRRSARGGRCPRHPRSARQPKGVVSRTRSCASSPHVKS